MPIITVKQTLDIDADIDIYCDTCGDGLCNTVIVNNKRQSFSVPVCENCIREKNFIISDLEDQIKILEKHIMNIEEEKNANKM